MPVDRYIITDRQWAKMEPLCLGKATGPGRAGGDARVFPEGVFWIARTGAQVTRYDGEAVCPCRHPLPSAPNTEAAVDNRYQARHLWHQDWRVP